MICIGEDQAAYLHNYGVGDRAIWDKNLPINDSKLQSMLSFSSQRYDLVIWSVGHPLLGCRGVETLRRLSALPPQRRFFDYLGAGIWRNFDKDNFYQSLSPLDINFMFAFWGEMLTYILKTWGDKLIIYPWSVAWWEKQLDFSISAVEILRENLERFQVQSIDIFGLPEQAYENLILSEEHFKLTKWNQ